MMTLKFADTHNMVTFLSKPTESDGFKQIVDLCTPYKIHARVDGKEIVITESYVRRDLQLADEEGIDCLPNSTIFEQLALMGLGKGFSGRVTPLFPTMVIQNQSQLGEGSAMATDPHHTPTILQPSSSQPQKTHKLRNPKRKDTQVPQPSNPTNNVVDEAIHKVLGDSLVRSATTASILEAEQESGSAMATDPHHTPTILQPSSSQPQKTHKLRNPKRKDTQVPQPSNPTDNVVDEAIHKVLGDSLVRSATTASSLEAEQESGNINKTQSKATTNEFSSQRTNSGGGPRCQETRGDTTAQTRVLDLEKTKTTQRNEIDSLKRRVKKLERRNRDEESLGEDASRQGMRIDAIDAYKDITLVNDADNEMFDVDDLCGKEMSGSRVQVAKGIVFQKPGKSTTATTTISLQQSQDKGKVITMKEPVKPKKKDQIRLNKEAAKRLQAEFDEEERLAREKAKID
nr:hypothetical protein [Tanacetum cinerariifolium]